jgi:hypothetical protein
VRTRQTPHVAAMGKEGLEPSRLSAHDPKSCLSASSSTSPYEKIISQRYNRVNKSDIMWIEDYLEELFLGRVVNPNGVGKDRTNLTRSVVLALRELVKQNSASQQTLDLAAYIVLALEAISETIETSVEPWEKRGYWLKADRFRLDWAWAASLGSAMRTAVTVQDWASVARTAAQIAEKLGNVDVPQRHRLGTPWVGAWERLISLDLPRSKNLSS